MTAIAVDLRSDTVTKPTPEMRKAMAEAEVGDDVLDHDPTMAELERRVAALTGKAAAIWVPSGCMSNIIAMIGHLGRGQRFLAPKHAHTLEHELGNAAWLAGGMACALNWAVKPGVPSVEDVRAEVAEFPPEGGEFDIRTTLLALENTHNHAGGT
ncbi:MAG: threonine aldolase family protein, partial [Bifidobacteriaceae bacterium]|nr:threonine aldolase family protein [Bifidobacteriaceae bacterium]